MLVQSVGIFLKIWGKVCSIEKKKRTRLPFNRRRPDHPQVCVFIVTLV